jgi:membrane protease YdiL (CAAX protease family)
LPAIVPPRTLVTAGFFPRRWDNSAVSTRRLLRFFLLAYAISWAFWIPAAAAAAGVVRPVPSTYLHLAGGLGPMLAALILTVVSGDRAGFNRLLRRSVSGGRWIALGVLIPAVLFVVSSGIVAVVLRQTLDLSAVGRSVELPEWPRPAYWLASLVCYGYGEEVGWRGFALPRLQAQMSALRASLLLTIGWALWHVPLFFFSPGLSQLDGAGIAGWLLSLALGSILLTWLFNSSGGSVAAVAAFHASLDIFITSPVAPALTSVMGALLTIGALALVPMFGARDLASRSRIVETDGV